jgi:hypothetical protein
MTDMREYIKTGKMIYDEHNGEFVASDEFEDYLMNLIEDGQDVSELEFYETKEISKPKFSNADLSDFAYRCGYVTYEQPLIDENKEIIDKINELYHSILINLYEPTNERLDFHAEYIIDK